jgi:hypothetical protein
MIANRIAGSTKNSMSIMSNKKLALWGSYKYGLLGEKIEYNYNIPTEIGLSYNKISNRHSNAKDETGNEINNVYIVTSISLSEYIAAAIIDNKYTTSMRFIRKIYPPWICEKFVSRNQRKSI